mmetsp:Transcript_24494/g.37264  ORF Transcript_24494/g.37264 Transcript_24494/m.37264 type:complete len:264 (-) Transcript_24494:500-1291(-)|eukprot:CAMPEP_0196131804 /NCGR_PEP_ID=MMETSP0910-20130528/1657_1 /TAXON_ID=49265 /ORGANISM="Thalassiosira rotula, Strain GSO102" /LENGTH=263 /DNA_ID=CAMNT_0041391317 /DNA_START=176 /DNA_END=967 /DNA_ORIENTATION=+
MVRPLSLLLFVSIAQSAVGISTSTRVPSSVLSILSLASFQIVTAENVDNVAAGAQECVEPGTCGDDDANADENSEQINEESNLEQNKTEDEPESPPVVIAEFSPAGERLISAEELALHTGKGGPSPDNPIWLSILGKVYDVTAGVEYYGEENGGYRYYAGRDASLCFSSGKNNDEGAAEDWTQWEDKQLVPVLEWARFYQDHETYKALGLFAGSQWFDANGVQTQARKDFARRAVTMEKIMHEEKQKKKAERLAKRKERKNRK